MPTKRIELPDRDYLRSRLRYNHDNGKLYWRLTGNIAIISGSRYPRVWLDNVSYQSHRIIWRMEVSDNVPHEVDHINLDKYDNRLENLRAATHEQNNRNRNLTKKNKSGFKGVSWCKNRQKWQVHIMVNKKSVSLGRFLDPAEAHQAYVSAAIKYFGEFANDGHGPVFYGS